MRLFGRFKQGALYAKFGQARINIHAALPAIKFRFASFHDTAGRLRALGSGGVNFRRIDIIAHAMDHGLYIGQLRMIVNNFANDLQEQNAVRVNMGLIDIVNRRLRNMVNKPIKVPVSFPVLEKVPSVRYEFLFRGLLIYC